MKDALLDTIVHPTAALFPLIEGAAFDELVDDIKRFGQLNPCVRHDGKLIDGRNRWRACRVAGIEPSEIEWAPVLGVTVSEWIISTNAIRRHMSKDQLAMCTTEAMKYVKEEKAARKAARQFQQGVSPNPHGRAGKPEEQVDTDSYPPVPKPDTKEKNARSTVGTVAAAAGVSHHKAAQSVALATAAEKSPEVAAIVEDVKAGKVKLKDAVKKVKSKDAKPAKAKSVKDPMHSIRDALGKLWSAVAAAEREAFRKQLYKIIDDLL